MSDKKQYRKQRSIASQEGDTTSSAVQSIVTYDRKLANCI